MKTSIEVENRKEGELIRAGLLPHQITLAACEAEIERLKAESAALNNEVRLLHNDATTHGTLLALVEQLAGACEAAIRLSDKYLDSAGRTKECQKVYDMNATALAAAAAYRKEKP